MATEPLIELGSNYELDEDSNGNLVIRDSSGNAILTYDDASSRWEVPQNIVPATAGTKQLGTSSQAWGAINTETVVNDRHYAGAFAGSDPDTRLDNALSAASTADVIYLENATYNADRTVSSTAVTLRGTDNSINSGTELKASWTFNNPVCIIGINSGSSATITAEGNNSVIRDCSTTDVTFQGSGGLAYGLLGGSVTFASGTSGGLVDSCRNGTSATDNGSNTEGDLG